jgi:glycosyltransferase involved in cell wall biosynthesis
MRVLFSVVTVVRNDLIGLKKTRESLEKQKYKNWIHIIVDGASGPTTQKYLMSLNKKNTIYISEPDSGIYDAMNKALKIAEPQSFVLYLNARDLFSNSNSLQEANKSLNPNPKINWGCTTHEEIQADGEGWVCKLVSPPSIPNQLYAFGYRSHQAVVMKAKFIAQLGGFDEDFKIAADWNLIAMAIKTEEPIIWNHPLCLFELGGFSAGKMLEAHLELRKIRKKYMNFNLIDRIVDDLWCAIFLRIFGYENYWTPLVQCLFGGMTKSNQHSRWRDGIALNLFFFKIRLIKPEHKITGTKRAKNWRLEVQYLALKIIRRYLRINNYSQSSGPT